MKRNQLLTAAAIVAVGISGAIAVAANVGIMNAADNTKVGQVSAASDLLTSSTLPIGTDSTLPDGSQQFVVDAAGTVNVSSTASSIHLIGAKPAPGWSWWLTQTQTDSLLVTFTNGTRTLQFNASADGNGTITAQVSEPAAIAAPTNTVSGTGGSHGDDEVEGGGDDD